jgi:hypothetical protein
MALGIAIVRGGAGRGRRVGVAQVDDMIATCTRAACNTITDMPDSHWLSLRPLVWTAFTEELTYCSVACLVMDQSEKHQPPRGLIP